MMLHTYSNLDGNLDEGSGRYLKRVFNVSAYTGRTIRVQFDSSQDDPDRSTLFLLDDVSLIVESGVPPTPTPTPTPTATPPAGTDPDSKIIYSAGAAHADGANGAFWLTDITFANGATSDLSVRIYLNDETSRDRLGFLLSAGQARTIVDIIPFIGLPDGSYVLRTEATCPSYAPSCPVDLFSVTARTYSLGYGGWFGTSLPDMGHVGQTRPVNKTLAFQEMANSRKALYVFGVPRGVTAYDQSGVVIAYVDLGLFAAGTLTRLPLPDNVSYVRIDGSRDSFCYGTQVDNATQSQIVIF